MSDQSPPDLLLPSGWTKNVKSAVLHVISVVPKHVPETDTPMHKPLGRYRGVSGQNSDDRIPVTA